MKAYHVEILDAEGKVLTQVDTSVARVSDIECVRSEDFVGIVANGQTVATGFLTVDQAKQAESFTARRTPLEGGAAVEIPVKR